MSILKDVRESMVLFLKYYSKMQNTFCLLLDFTGFFKNLMKSCGCLCQFKNTD